jgi:hypothetical protein
MGRTSTGPYPPMEPDGSDLHGATNQEDKSPTYVWLATVHLPLSFEGPTRTRETIMLTRNGTLLSTLILIWAMSTPQPTVAGWLVGGSLSIGVDDSPLGTSFTQNLTLMPGTTTIDAGEMTLTQSIFQAGPHSQWLVLDFEATGGHLLAGNPDIGWQAGGSGQLSSPSINTSIFAYWSVDGIATQTIHPFGQFTSIETNPIDPNLGLVYYANRNTAPSEIIGGSGHANPYNVISQGGMNPGKVDGFVLGLLEVDVNAVPEPSTIGLMMFGILGVGTLRWWRGRIA